MAILCRNILQIIKRRQKKKCLGRHYWSLSHTVTITKLVVNEL